MGALDDLLGKALPGGKISKPLLLALLALLASGALSRRGGADAGSSAGGGGLGDLLGGLLGGGSTPAPGPSRGGPAAGNNPLGDLLGGLLGGGAGAGDRGNPGAGSNPLGDLLGNILTGGAGRPAPRAAAAPGPGGNPLGDLLGGLLGGGAGPAAGGAGGGALAGGLLGGLGSLLEGMQQHGQGDIADSWIGTGQNRQIDPRDLGSALDPDVVRHLAEETGMDEEEVLSQLSEGMPDLVDQLTPGGQLPSANELGRLSRQLG